MTKWWLNARIRQDAEWSRDTFALACEDTGGVKTHGSLHTTGLLKILPKCRQGKHVFELLRHIKAGLEHEAMDIILDACLHAMQSLKRHKKRRRKEEKEKQSNLLTEMILKWKQTRQTSACRRAKEDSHVQCMNYRGKTFWEKSHFWALRRNEEVNTWCERSYQTAQTDSSCWREMFVDKCRVRKNDQE